MWNEYTYATYKLYHLWFESYGQNSSFCWHQRSQHHDADVRAMPLAPRHICPGSHIKAETNRLFENCKSCIMISSCISVDFVFRDCASKDWLPGCRMHNITPGVTINMCFYACQEDGCNTAESQVTPTPWTHVRVVLSMVAGFLLRWNEEDDSNSTLMRCIQDQNPNFATADQDRFRNNNFLLDVSKTS